jgi:hypothetical protein
MAFNNQNLKPQTFEIEKPYVIVCEGDDDMLFLICYLNFLDKSKLIDEKKFKIIKTDGVDNIPKNMKLFKNYDHYEDMKGFLFIRDADKNPDSAVNSMVGNIKDIWGVKLDKTGNFKTDSEDVKLGFFIFPGFDDSNNYRKGTLEDLCTETFKPVVGNQDILALVDEHMEKLNDIGISFKTPHKNRLHLCLDSTNDFLGDKIGESAKKHAFDFSSDKFATLKARIIELTR